MGGKRPDQYAIDPGEANATDYKERDSGEKIREQDKQALAQTRVEEREAMIPRRGKNPALAELQARREQKQQEERGED